MSSNNLNPKQDLKAIVVGCASTELTADEKALFADHPPAGFILFQRNCVSEAQVTDLVSSFRDVIGWEHAPVLIDQEGGTVSRLKAPVWQEFPAAVDFAKLAETDLDAASQVVYQNAVLMGMDLAQMGVTVNCAPVMDVPTDECHGFLADSRAYGRDVEQVTMLAEHVCRGLLAAGVTPVMKHIPGHGRGSVDSHMELPKVTTESETLQQTDYAPFRNLSAQDIGEAVWAMGAHIIYTDVDTELAATLSPKIVEDVIRQDIGFDGVAIADDIGMQALAGDFVQRAKATLASGLDMTLHCSGKFDEMQPVLQSIDVLSDRALMRIVTAEEKRQSWTEKDPLNGKTRTEALSEMEQMLNNVKAVA